MLTRIFYVFLHRCFLLQRKVHYPPLPPPSFLKNRKQVVPLLFQQQLSFESFPFLPFLSAPSPPPLVGQDWERLFSGLSPLKGCTSIILCQDETPPPLNDFPPPSYIPQVLSGLSWHCLQCMQFLPPYLSPLVTPPSPSPNCGKPWILPPRHSREIRHTQLPQLVHRLSMHSTTHFPPVWAVAR